MKKIFTAAFLLFTLSSQAQIIPSDCSVPSVLIENYDWDIKGLAVDRMNATNHPDKNNVIIPQIIQDSIAQGLAAILNADVLPERDSIFNLYCVHNGAFSPITTGIIVGVDESYNWTTHWQNLETTTGDTLMDYITQRYQLTISSYSSFALLETPKLWNTAALCDSIKLVAGVNYAEPNYFIGGAGKINYSVQPNGVKRYKFSFEWSDCFDGCDNRHSWFYSVYDDCSVEFTGVEDFGFFGIQPLPNPVNCNIISGTETLQPSLHPIQIFPNPTSEYFSIQNLPNSELNNMSILNTAGQLIRTEWVNSTSKIDISKLTKGVYFIKITAKNGYSQTKKLIIL